MERTPNCCLIGMRNIKRGRVRKPRGPNVWPGGRDSGSNADLGLLIGGMSLFRGGSGFVSGAS